MKIYKYGNMEAPIILVQPVDDHDMEVIEQEVKLIEESLPNSEEFGLMAVKVDDWNNDLSPWTAPPVFGKEDFGGMAEETLKEILSICDDESKTYIIGGYSLAGLFALWAAHNTDKFVGVAAASPSVWFPGFVEYMKDNRENIASNEVKAVYLSLGDKEEKTRNQVMARVGDCIRKANVIIAEEGISCTLEWNEGNHFRDSDFRTAKAFAWAVNQLSGPAVD